jgi:L-2-hydroxyglutarate oxidase
MAREPMNPAAPVISSRFIDAMIGQLMRYDYAIVGGGIVGLATALALPESASVLLIEKENAFAAHQTGRNSGVIHSGVYYRPGSLKARMAVEGNRSMVEFCRAHAIPFAICGKLIVATAEDEIPRLRKLEENARGIGVITRWLDHANEIEPHVNAVAALHVPSTGVVDYRRVAETMATLIRGQIELSCRVLEIRDDVIATTRGEFRAKTIINCAGLFADRIAHTEEVRIVPFRGEYYDVTGESASLVRTLIYPVPNPDFPFLGVHLTRGIEGHVHAGPNAVLAFKREGYRWRDVSPRDTLDTLTYGGFWRLAARNWEEGGREVMRSLSRRLFARSVQRLVPAIAERDLQRAPAGVRAQALMPSGSLADDFVIVRRGRAIHVCNAPSPGATASIEIGRFIARESA